MGIDIVEAPKRDTLNLQHFLNDMGMIQQQLKSPDLVKPAFDVGNSSVTNYLLWLVLAELMMMNDRRGVNA